MSAPKAAFDRNPVYVLEEGLCPALQRILDTYFRSLAVITDTLSEPDTAATIQNLLLDLKTQQDILMANVSESLTLIDELWLLMQLHFERQIALVSRPVDLAEVSATGTVASPEH